MAWEREKERGKRERRDSCSVEDTSPRDRYKFYNDMFSKVREINKVIKGQYSYFDWNKE